MEEDSHAQENDGVDVDNVPPQRFFWRVSELLLQLGLLFWTQFWGLFLVQSAEAHDCFLAEARFLLIFCNAAVADKESLILNKNEPYKKKMVCICIHYCFSTKSITDTNSLLLTFCFHFRVVLINPVLWFDVYSLLRTVPQTPAQSIQLKK